MDAIFKCRPAAPLDTFVESIWMLPADALADSAVTLLPVGRASIAIALGSSDFHVYSADGSMRYSVASPLLCHAATEPVSMGLPPAFTGRVVGANFKIAGLRAFTTKGLAEIPRGVYELRQLWGEQVMGWGEQLERAMDAGDVAVLALMEKLLASKLRAVPGYDICVDEAMAALADVQGNASVAAVASQRGLAPKAFRHAFRDATGFNPKWFARVTRFRSTLQQLRREDILNLTEVAVDHEYTDQAHFVHDFKALSGMTPSAYRSNDEHGACLFTRLKSAWSRLTSANPGRPADRRAPSGP
jgi:AraC-like DNA-binding protein